MGRRENCGQTCYLLEVVIPFSSSRRQGKCDAEDRSKSPFPDVRRKYRSRPRLRGASVTTWPRQNVRWRVTLGHRRYPVSQFAPSETARLRNRHRIAQAPFQLKNVIRVEYARCFRRKKRLEARSRCGSLVVGAKRSCLWGTGRARGEPRRSPNSTCESNSITFGVAGGRSPRS